MYRLIHIPTATILYSSYFKFKLKYIMRNIDYYWFSLDEKRIERESAYCMCPVAYAYSYRPMGTSKYLFEVIKD